MDKQDSIRKMRSIASKLIKYIFDTGDKTREKRAVVCGTPFVAVHSTKMTAAFFCC
jgi:hypothetical protein